MDINTVKKIAHLSRLSLTEEEIQKHAGNLENVLALAEKMATLDTTHVEPMSHPLDLHQRMREDVVTEANQRDQLQKLAPLTEAGLYLVPQVIEEE